MERACDALFVEPIRFDWHRLLRSFHLPRFHEPRERLNKVFGFADVAA